MPRIDKILNKMRNNTRAWQIAELEVIAVRFGISARKRGSHVTFAHPKWVEILTVPAHRPIKPIYVKRFVSLIDILKEEES